MQAQREQLTGTMLCLGLRRLKAWSRLMSATSIEGSTTPPNAQLEWRVVNLLSCSSEETNPSRAKHHTTHDYRVNYSPKDGCIFSKRCETPLALQRKSLLSLTSVHSISKVGSVFPTACAYRGHLLNPQQIREHGAKRNIHDHSVLPIDAEHRVTGQTPFNLSDDDYDR